MKKTFFALLAIIFLFSCSGEPFDINKEGGTVITMKPDQLDFLIRLSGHSQEPGFLSALDQTRKGVKEHNVRSVEDFVVYYKLLNKKNPAHIFYLADREKFTLNMSDEELKKKLMEEYSYAIDRTKHILEQRLERFGISESEKNLHKDRSGNIVIEIGGQHDLQRLRKLLQASAEFGFYETYENKDVYPYIEKINNELSRELYPGIDTMAQESSECQKMKYPIFRYLQPDTHQSGRSGQYEFSKGCRIGFSKLSDTAKVNYLLKMETTRLIAPRDMVFAWSLKPEDMGNEVKDVAGLYVLKARNIFEPALSGNVITNARVTEEPNTRRLNVEMNMSSEGAAEWEKITRKNIDKAIAMVLDGYVLTAPIVQGPIPNGFSVISGNFTKEEAEEVAIILQSGSLPVRTYIIDEKKVEPKK